MPKFALLLLGSAVLSCAEVRTLTLRQALDLAIKQNPDLALARLDEERARQAVRLAQDPFRPHLTVGSGLAYSNGFPMSIEGSAPSVVQARASAFVFNRAQSLTVAQAREDARGASLGTAGKREEVAYRIATLYLDAERAARVAALMRKDAESRQKVLDTVQAQVREGRALPLEEKTAALELARARQTADSLEDDRVTAETALSIALGFSAQDRIQAAAEDRPRPALPVSEEDAMQSALASSKDIQRLESRMSAKQIEMRAAKAARWPRVDLVAQYGMLARFNNYEDFFQKFQRNNGEVGVSFQVPILSGPAVGAQAGQSQADLSRLRIELSNTRNRLASDLQQAFRDTRKAQSAGEVARLDLEVAREQLTVDLALMQEGRLTLRQVEEARIVENQKWIAFYDAQYAIEKARWTVLRLTGTLLAAAGAESH